MQAPSGSTLSLMIMEYQQLLVQELSLLDITLTIANILPIAI
jgi:hypothetical protein